MKLLGNELSSAEASFLKWQYGFEDPNAPFERALWQAILRAWEMDHAAGVPSAGKSQLARLGSAGAYPEEVALYVRFKSGESDALWRDLIRRAGLADRRSAKAAVGTERRRRN